MFNEKQKQTLLIGIVLAILGGVAVGLVWMNKWAPDRQRAETRITRLTAERTELQTAIREFDALINNPEELEVLRARVEEAKERLPTDRQAAEFLEYLRESLQLTGVSQEAVIPSRTVSRELYEEIPYVVRGSARYHELGQFFNMIEANPKRFMRIDTFTISNSSRRPSVHPFEVKISTFMFKS